MLNFYSCTTFRLNPKCISESYDSEKQKTHPQKWDGSSLVDFSVEMSNNLLSDFDKFLDFLYINNL